MSRKNVQIVHRQSGETILASAHWCTSRWSRFLGFQFRRRLKPGEALVLVHKKDSISASSIHMFFVFTPLAVAWINQEGRVTQVALARPWRPYYASPTPASLVLETEPEFFGQVGIGDFLDFIPLKKPSNAPV
jgi:uncharacterized membrane protein (UPF0127 family)